MTTIKIATASAEVASFGDFIITLPISTTTGWSDSDINLVHVNILSSNLGSTAVANQKFNITYVAYNGSTFNVTKLFVYNSSAFVYMLKSIYKTVSAKNRLPRETGFLMPSGIQKKIF